MTPLRKPGPPVNSGRGRAHLGSAIGRPEPVAKPRKPLSPVSARKVADGRAVEGESVLRRGSGPKPSRGNRKRPPQPEEGWHAAVFAWLNSEYPDLAGRDLVSLQPLEPGYEMHHVVEASSMWAERLPDGTRVAEAKVTVLGVAEFAIWHPYAGVPANQRTHHGQTTQMAPMPTGALLSEHRAFVDALDDLVGRGWASARIVRLYRTEGR